MYLLLTLLTTNLLFNNSKNKYQRIKLSCAFIDEYRQQRTPPAVNPSDIYAVSAKKMSSSTPVTATTNTSKATSSLTTHLRAVSPVRSPSPRFNSSPAQTYNATVKVSDSYSNGEILHPEIFEEIYLIFCAIDYGSQMVSESRYHTESRYSTSNGARLLSPPSPPQIRSSPMMLNGTRSPVFNNSTNLRATPSPKPPGQVDTSSNVRGTNKYFNHQKIGAFLKHVFVFFSVLDAEQLESKT